MGTPHTHCGGTSVLFLPEAVRGDGEQEEERTSHTQYGSHDATHLLSLASHTPPLNSERVWALHRYRLVLMDFNYHLKTEIRKLIISHVCIIMPV